MRPYTSQDVKALERQAAQLRRDVVSMVHKAGSGHPGGSLSAAEIVTALYFHVMNVDPAEPRWPDRDRFILSKGHCCPVYYAALAHKGYFPVEELDTLRDYKSILQGHPDMNVTPGVDMTAGSLGNGLSIGMGMALSARLHKQNYRTYVVMGDGEIQEGMVWEAAMAAAHHRLDNLVAIVDVNGIQINGWVDEILRVDPLADKWKAFGWNVVECDGHDMRSVLSAFHRSFALRGAPTVILAHTVKGKGVSFMEDEKAWHGMAPNAEQTRIALEELADEEGGSEV